MNGFNPISVSIQVIWIDAIVGLNARGVFIRFKWIDAIKPKGMTVRFGFKQIDVTNIGKQHSLIDTINKAPIEENLQNLNDVEI